MAVTGVDFSDVAIKKARRTLGNKAKLLTTDLENIDCLQGKYDLILCKDTFTFIKNKEGFVKKVKNLMNDNATFIIITPVLHKGIKYIKLDKPKIAVDFQETKKLLQNNFSNVLEFHHHYTSENVDITTFINTK